MSKNSIPPFVVNRRRFLTAGSGFAVSALLGGPLLAACGSSPEAAGTQTAGGSTKGDGPGTSAPNSGTLSPVDYQIAWVGDNGALGGAVALRKGFYKEAGLDLTMRRGGPSVDPVTSSASGSVTWGQTSSSPAIMLSRSQGIPIKCFATGLQSWPWAIISKKENPVRKPEDLIGKTLGTQSTTGIILDALFAHSHIDPKEVDVQVVGSEVTPLVTGRIDAFTAWTTNLQAFEPLGDDYVTMTLADAGIPSYANLYIATDDVVEKRADDLEAFLIATGRGWAYAHENPDEAVDLMLKEFSGLEKEPQLEAAKKLMSYMFDDDTAANGWGTMKRDNWQAQLDLWGNLGQFKGNKPNVDDVVTFDILDATKDQRPKIGA